jgi:integrase
MPLKLYRRGKIWHYRGTIAGRRLRGSTGTASKEVAQRIASSKEQIIWKGHLDGPASVLTFAQAAMLYRQAEKSDRFLGPVEDYWKNTPIKGINPAAIRDSAIALYPNAGPATRNRQAIVPAQAVINHAYDRELCAHIRVKRFKVVRKRKPAATWEWVQAFMANAVKPNLAGLACLMFLTGARISQALSIKWTDVDFKARKVLIRGTLKGGGEPDREARMPDELVAALARITRDGELVFSFKSRGNCRTQWAGACRRAGIKYLSYHRCRAGFASGLLSRGVSPATVADRGGWRDQRTVLQFYSEDIEDADVTDILTGTNLTRHAKKLNEAS